MDHQSSLHYDNDLNSRINQVRRNIHPFGRSYLSMLFTESELKRRNTDGTSLLHVSFRNRNETDKALNKLQISGDLIPLSTYTCASVITREHKQQNSVEKKRARKLERLAARKAARQAAIQGVTPLSKARDDVIRKVNDLLGRGREQTTVTYVAHSTLERIASYVFVGELRNTSADLYYASASEALMPCEALMYAYNKEIGDAYTRARVHLHLTSRGLISMVPCPGRPHAIRIRSNGRQSKYRSINSEDVEMFWIQMEKIYVLTEMIERGMISRHRSRHRLYPEIAFYSKERFNDPTERGKVNKLTNAELEERLAEINTRLKLAERKPYAARQKQIDSDVIEEMFSNKYRCDIDPKILRSIFSSDSPYAQQLINIYILLHSALDYNSNWNAQKLQNIADGQPTDSTGLNDIKYTYAAVGTLLRFRRRYFLESLESLVVPDDYLANWNHKVHLGKNLGLRKMGVFNISVAIHDLALTLATYPPAVENPDLSHLALVSPGLKDLSIALAVLENRRGFSWRRQSGLELLYIRITRRNGLNLGLAKIALVTYVLANVALTKPGLTFKPLINLARSNPDLAKFFLANPELAHDSVAGFIERSPSLGDVCLAIHTLANLVLPDRQLLNRDRDDDYPDDYESSSSESDDTMST